MKALVILSLLSISLNSFADYKSEVKAIEKFEVEEYNNQKNYPPSKPGEIREINKAFADKLNSDPVALKYFVLLTVAYRLVGLYKSDKAFALSLESKFDGKKMDKDKWEKVFEYVGNPILKESNSEHKKAIASRSSSEAHFQKSVALLNGASFK